MTRYAIALFAALTPPAAIAAQPEPDAASIAAELKAMRTRIAELEAQLAAMQARQAAPPTAPAAPPPPVAPAQAALNPVTDISWRGAPVLKDAKSGFSFKPRGFLQFDTGYVENPSNLIATPNLGYATRARRIVFGADGTLPGGFGYRAEFNFAGGQVDYEDVVITWASPKVPIQFTLGNFFPLAGLETMTSSRLTSFLEREQAQEAFGFNRRLGVAASLVDPDDLYSLTAGLFAAPINTGFNNDGWQASIRALASPRLGEDKRLHLGINYQHRVPQSDGQNVRYLARPLSRLTDFRFVDTFAIAAKSEDIVGLELAGISGPLHVAAEAHRVWVNGYRPGTIFSGYDGVNGGLFYPEDPVFNSGYAEVGLFLTGETRGYRGGRWDNVRVARPLGKGGFGAFQINARFDRLDLSDAVASAVPGYPDPIEGGVQTGYSLSAIWNPTDYLRFLLQYARIDVDSGPSFPLPEPGDPASPGPRNHRIDSVALRSQIEF